MLGDSCSSYLILTVGVGFTAPLSLPCGPVLMCQVWGNLPPDRERTWLQPRTEGSLPWELGFNLSSEDTSHNLTGDQSWDGAGRVH